jgi:hypothetical protein
MTSVNHENTEKNGILEQVKTTAKRGRSRNGDKMSPVKNVLKNKWVVW